VELPEFEAVVSDIREQMEREIEQGVLQHDLYKATAALGGKDACDRILRALRFRSPRRAELREVRRRGA